MVHPEARLRQIRAMAAGEGDWHLVAEVEREMARLGIPVDDVETTADTATYEVVVPRRPRGRPRKVS